MLQDSRALPLLCVTNRSLCAGDFLMQLQRAASLQPAGILLREKDLDASTYAQLAGEVEGSLTASIPTSLAQSFWYSLWAVAPVQKMRVTLDFFTSSFMLFTTGSSMLVSLAPTMVQLSRTSHRAT